jgi:PIN domain
MVRIVPGPPPKRLYFDTNILRGWPNCSNEVWNIFSVANWLKTELYIPKVVEDELEAQFVRNVNAILDTLDTTVSQYRKLCRHIIETDINGSAPTDKQLEEAFRARSEEIKQHYSITSIPLTTVSLEVFVNFAIHRHAPFEQILIEKNKHGVVGLQDAAILFSIIQHISKEQGRCILLSADKIFSHEDVEYLLDQSNVKLERVKSAGDLWKEFSEHIWEAIRIPWGEERDLLSDDLNAQKEALGRQIEELINAPGFDQKLWARAKVRQELNITEFAFIMTNLPEDLPPRSPYHRKEGSKVLISARATAEMKALVEHSEWSSIFGPPIEGPSPVPGLNHATLTEYLTISIEGSVREGKITDFKVTAIDTSKP